MAQISEWLQEDELIINLAKGKTEALLFGRAKHISKSNEPLLIPYANTTITPTTTYKYLGVELDAALNLNMQFDASLKCASTRLRLLSKIRNTLNVESGKIVYQTMIVLLLTYCGALNFKLTSTQPNRLAFFQEPATKI